mmetsp:Transcript_26413/g.71391  ORF Transcript_26413/g.71391 Transcript_26413/m.71391 type:complete len:124 (-) Transcript_26413:757-1128(-)|eukprot:scaffold210997_cov16-Tisochrysis_lutea.AAC.2
MGWEVLRSMPVTSALITSSMQDRGLQMLEACKPAAHLLRRVTLRRLASTAAGLLHIKAVLRLLSGHAIVPGMSSWASMLSSSSTTAGGSIGIDRDLLGGWERSGLGGILLLNGASLLPKGMLN